ncbi:MAG: diacylglycerol kinase family protein [Planctomycetaceae bacterium]|jgi:diacylglycerol kinase (ATP)|nr:diacylglycerol kinase family protein [Planctomycetaceae bacterium]
MQEDNFQENSKYIHSKRTWRRKFGDAFRGLYSSFCQQSSYRVHFFFALTVPVLAWLLKLNEIEWSLLILLITLVIASEMFNTAIETLSRAVSEQYDERIGRSLDIASGAVLIVSIGSALVGILIFGKAILRLWNL